MTREWLVIESSRKNAVFAPDEARSQKGYIPRDVAERLLGRDLGGTVWFSAEESALLQQHEEWLETIPTGAKAMTDINRLIAELEQIPGRTIGAISNADRQCIEEAAAQLRADHPEREAHFSPHKFQTGDDVEIPDGPMFGIVLRSQEERAGRITYDIRLTGVAEGRVARCSPLMAAPVAPSPEAATAPLPPTSESDRR